MKLRKYLTVALTATLMVSCSSGSDDDDNRFTIDPAEDATLLYVVNSGSYGAGNASLSAINLDNGVVTNDVFRTANTMSLGDVANSMTMGCGLGWIVVNNSNVVFAIDPLTCEERGRIDSGIISPRNLYFISDSKAYLTQLYDNRIAVIDPSTYSVTGYIAIDGMDAATGSTESIVVDGRYAYCTCWSYQKKVVKIDTVNDRVVASAEVGVQPKNIVIDANGDLRVLTDGGWFGNPNGYEPPAIVTLDPTTLAVKSKITMELGDYVTSMITNDDRSVLYWLRNNTVMQMASDATSLPASPYIQASSFLNALTIDPRNGDLIVADAIDYQQPGAIYRYRDGELVSTYTVGVIPAGFCWK